MGGVSEACWVGGGGGGWRFSTLGFGGCHEFDDGGSVGGGGKAPFRRVSVDVAQRCGGGPSVEYFHRVGGDQAWVLDTAGFGDLDQVPSEGLDVGRGPNRFQAGVQAVREPSVLRRNAGG